MLIKLALLVIVINLSLMDIYLLRDYLTRTTNLDARSEVPGSEDSKTLDSCGEECKKYIDEKIAQLQEIITPSVEPTIARPRTTLASKPKNRVTTYIPIPGSGGSNSTDWKTLEGTDFYLSKSEYPGLTGVYFEANLKLINGNGKAYVRIYDITHSIGVVGSEASTSNQTSTFLPAGPLNLWEGYNHYAVQIKSLTADTAFFESGKLKVITEN